MLDSVPQHRVLSCQELAAGTVRLRLERRNLAFLPGQYFSLAALEGRQFREYTVHSGIGDDFLDFLIRSVGPVSRALAAVQAGDWVQTEGPFGVFTLEETGRPHTVPQLFVASGVAIAPFHAMIRSMELDYLVLHGVRCATELYDRTDFAADRHLACVSGMGAGFTGRVSDCLRQRAGKEGSACGEIGRRWGSDWAQQLTCWLAGNSGMVHDVFDILVSAGVAPASIRTEIFF